MLHGLAVSTSTNYNSYLNGFIRFCEANRLQSLPASVETILLYLGHLTEKGTVAAESLQPYLSAINTWHSHLGLDSPALGPAVQQARAGMARRQALSEGYKRDQRVPLPSRVVKKILFKALAELATLTDERLRDVALVTVSFLWFCRSATGHSAHVEDVGVSPDSLFIRVRNEKGRATRRDRRVLRIPLGGDYAVNDVVTVFNSFLQRRTKYEDKLAHRRHLLWPLPTETQWKAESVNDCLKRVLQWVNESPPPSFVWLSHSLRSGPATACNSIGVVLPRICDVGGWSALSQAVHDYIDVNHQPTPEDWYFFGWMVPQPMAFDRPATRLRPRVRQS